MIGLWVARFTPRRHGSARVTLWHLVQSEIEDRKVLKCGKQMGDIEGTSLAPLVAPPTVESSCYWCR